MTANTQDFKVQIVANVAIHCQIEDILGQLIEHKKAWIRFYVIQEIHELWHGDDELTTRLLSSLAGRIQLLHFNRSRAYFDSLLKCSVLLVSRDYLTHGSNTQSLSVVLRIWQKLIRRYFFVTSIKPINRVLRYFRKALISLGVSGVIRLLARLGNIGGFISNYDDLVSFFPADSDRQKIFSDLFAFFDSVVVNPLETLPSFVEYVESLILSGDADLITSALVLAVSTAYIVNTPVETAKAWHDLYSRFCDLYPLTVDPTNATAPLWSRMLVPTFLNPPYSKLEISSARQVAQYAIAVEYLCEEHFKGAGYFPSGKSSHWDFLGGAIAIGYWVDRENLGYPALQRMFDLLIEREDHFRIKAFAAPVSDASSYLGISDIGIMVINDGLFLLRNYLENLEETGRREFWEGTTESLLLNYGVYHRDSLKFLGEVAFDILPDEVRVQLQHASPVDSFDFVLTQSVAAVARQSLQDENPTVRNLLKVIFQQALKSHSFKDWLVRCTVYFGNLISEDELFPT